MEICAICMENVFLPVELISFDCFRDNQINCSSLTRCCRKCVHDFLQLDTDSFERDFVRRCLFCPGLAHPRFLNHCNAYRKDFMLMKQDVHVYHCPYCHDMSGTQITINRHLETDCEMIPVQWLCGHITIRKEKEDHVASCEYYTKCQFCEEYMIQSELKPHMLNDHNLIECALCRTILPRLLMNHHMTYQCPERRDTCEVCHEEFRHDEIHQHYETHLKKIETEVFLCKRQLVKLMRDYRKIRSILHLNYLTIT